MSCEIVGSFVALLFSGVGYFARGYVDLHHKKRNERFEGRLRAAEAISPLISEYMRLSDDLCGDTSFRRELTMEGCIYACKGNVRKLVDLEMKLHDASNQVIRYLDKKTAQEIKKLNLLLSTQLRELSRNFEAADESAEDGNEVLRIMECGFREYCTSYKRQIRPVLNEVNSRIRN